MNTTTAFTKSEALRKQVLSGKMANDKQRILEFAMKNKGFLIPLLKARLGMEKVSTVSARVVDLQDMGLLEADGWALSHGEKHGIYVYVKDPERRKRLIVERHRMRAERWKRRGKEFEAYFEVIEKNVNLDGQTKLF